MGVGLIVPAAGRGERLGVGVPKAFADLGGKPLLWFAIVNALRSGVVDTVAVAKPPSVDRREVSSLIEAAIVASGATEIREPVITDGGASRDESVSNALAALPGDVDIVLVHDAARCLAPPVVFVTVAGRVAEGADAVVPVLPLVDTVKHVDGDLVVSTPDRSALRVVQTPQGFRREILAKAHAEVTGEVTDDAGMVERIGGSVHVVPGHPDGFKVTTPFDLRVAEAVVAQRAAR